jgi:hypothetical protein
MASWSSRGLRSRKAALLLAWWLGLYQPPDRRALSEIWHALARDEAGFRVLFVGVRAYTWRLTRAPRRATIVTIDRDPRTRFFGARRHHVGLLQELGSTGEPAFDLAIVNGVLGAGIDTVAEAERALGALHDALRPGGVLVLGVNEERPTMPDLAAVTALRQFREIASPPFGVHRHVVPSPFEGSHTFLFFERS